jgi:hypothetical protein
MLGDRRQTQNQTTVKREAKCKSRRTEANESTKRQAKEANAESMRPGKDAKTGTSEVN